MVALADGPLALGSAEIDVGRPYDALPLLQRPRALRSSALRADPSGMAEVLERLAELEDSLNVA